MVMSGTMPRRQRSRGLDVSKDPRINSDKTPPTAEDQEDSLAAFCCISTANADLVLDLVSPEAAGRPYNPTLFETVRRMRGAGREISVKSVTREIREAEGESAEGVLEHLKNSLQDMQGVPEPQVWAAEVNRTHGLRRMIFGMLAAIDHAYDPFADPVELLDQMVRDSSVKRSGSASEMEIVRLSDVTPVPVRWMWNGWFAYGKLSILCGDFGKGKSQILTGLTGAVTTIGRMPDGSPCELGEVLFMASEDDIGDTVVPRMEAAGVDRSKVVTIKSVTDIDPKTGKKLKRMFRLDRDIARIEQFLQANPNIRLVALDPLNSWLGTADYNSAADIRRVLEPFIALASQYNVAVVCLHHLNRDKTGAVKRAVDRMSGSAAYGALARCVAMVADDPEIEGRFIMAQVKNNLGPLAKPIGYTIVDGPRVVWDMNVGDIDFDDVLRAGKRSKESKTAALDEAVEWLKERLGNGEAVKSDQIEEEAKAAGISERTFWRARKEAGVKARRCKGEWVITLPYTQTPSPDLLGSLGTDGSLGSLGSLGSHAIPAKTANTANSAIGPDVPISARDNSNPFAELPDRDGVPYAGEETEGDF